MAVDSLSVKTCQQLYFYQSQQCAAKPTRHNTSWQEFKLSSPAADFADAKTAKQNKKSLVYCLDKNYYYLPVAPLTPIPSYLFRKEFTLNARSHFLLVWTGIALCWSMAVSLWHGKIWGAYTRCEMKSRACRGNYSREGGVFIGNMLLWKLFTSCIWWEIVWVCVCGCVWASACCKL